MNILTWLFGSPSDVGSYIDDESDMLLLSQVGEGAFGSVSLIRQGSTGKLFAAKKSLHAGMDLATEIGRCLAVDHRNVAKAFPHYYDDGEGLAYQTKLPKPRVRAAALGYRDAADFHSLVVPEGEDAGVISGFALKLAAKVAGLDVESGDFSDDFHVFRLDWDEAGMKWYVDDILYRETPSSQWFSASAPSPAPFNQRFHLILNLAVGGNWPKNPDASTAFPSRMEVDWVRVYE